MAAMSQAERTVARHLEAFGLAYSTQFRLGRWRFDLALAGQEGLFAGRYSGPPTLIEVHGCYWHRCSVCRTWPEGAQAGNIQRHVDNGARKVADAERAGFRVLVFWEHEVRDRSIAERLSLALALPPQGR